MTTKLKNKQTRMVGYGRVSTDQEKQLDSLKNQVQFFSEYAADNGYQLIQVYADEGISGKQLKNREQFLQMIKDAQFDLFDVVVVKDVSRFARNTVDLLTAVRKLKGMGINVVFVNNNQESMGDSELILTIFAAMAQEESANLSKRVQFGKDINAKRGRVPREILGYDKVDNFNLRINEGEARLVRRIYDLYLSGMYGMAAIATLLRGEKVQTKKGCAYTEGYIRRVLSNPIYCGDLVNHKTVTTDYINGVRTTLPEEEQYHHHRPELAIIDRETFDRAQRIRTERCRMQMDNGRDPRRRYTSRHLLSGIVRCGECGRTMFRQEVKRKNGKVDVYWRCPNGTRMKNDDRCTNQVQIRNDFLEETLSEFLRQCVGDKASFAAMVQAHRESIEERETSPEEELAEKHQTMDRLQKQKEKYIEMCSNDIITMEELRQYTQGINSQLEQLTREMALIRQEQTVLQDSQRSVEECIVDIENFLTLENAKNSDIRRFLSKIDVGKDRDVSFVFRVDQP